MLLLFSMNRRRIRLHGSQGGFTIIEMMVVVALIVLISSVGSGLYSGSYQGMLVRKAAREVFIGAKYARIKAIESGQICRLEISAEGNKFALVIDEMDEKTGETLPVMVSDYYFKPVEFGGEVKFEQVEVNRMDEAYIEQKEVAEQICFRPDGTAEAALIQIGDGKRHYSLRISEATGKSELFFGLADEIENDTIDLDAQWQQF